MGGWVELYHRGISKNLRSSLRFKEWNRVLEIWCKSALPLISVVSFCLIFKLVIDSIPSFPDYIFMIFRNHGWKKITAFFGSILAATLGHNATHTARTPHIVSWTVLPVSDFAAAPPAGWGWKNRVMLTFLSWTTSTVLGRQ